MAKNMELYRQCLVTCKGPARSLAGHVVRLAEKTAAFDGVTLPVLYAGWEGSEPDLSDLTADLARRLSGSGRIPNSSARMTHRLSFQNQYGLRTLDQTLRRAAAEQFQNRWQGILVLELESCDEEAGEEGASPFLPPASPEYIRAVAEYIADQPQILWILTAPLEDRTPLLFHLRQLTHLIPVQMDANGRVQTLRRLEELLERQGVCLSDAARSRLEQSLGEPERSEEFCQRLARELCLCAMLLDECQLEEPHVMRCLNSLRAC